VRPARLASSPTFRSMPRVSLPSGDGASEEAKALRFWSFDRTKAEQPICDATNFNASTPLGETGAESFRPKTAVIAVMEKTEGRY
jgi:hypothetical protein